MLTNLFESRNKTFLNLVKLGDYIGRSLRENVELFSVDNDSVTYLTESGHVIKGNFDKHALKLTNIKVDNSNIFEDKEVYSKLVDNKVTNFLADILENDLKSAQESFESVLGIWETRLHFDRVKNRLLEKCQKFNDSLKITSTPEFNRLKEIKDDLIKYLKESNTFINIPEVRNTIKLSSVISKSFNSPKIEINNLKENKFFEIPQTLNHTLYDHLCKQELIAKEFIEAKNNLDHVWISNEKIQKLPSYIYESNDNLMQLMAEIITDVPYFAMATKKQLLNLVEGNLDLLSDRNLVSQKDIKEFISKIFEFKKPVKNYLLNVLNEKYGINVQNLTDQPTFNSLIKTQILIFESLAKLTPKNSVMKKVLAEFSDVLKSKNGVESIDVSNFLNEVFEGAEYTNILNETQLMNYLNFDKVADDLGKIGQVLKMIQAGMGGGMGGGMPSPMGAGAAPQAGMPQPSLGGSDTSMAQQVPQGEGEYESDGGDLAGMGGDSMGNPAGEAEDVANDIMNGEEGEEGELGMPPEEGMDDGEEDVEFMEQDQLVDNLKELEGLIATLKNEIGLGGQEGDEDMVDDGEMPDEEGVPDEEMGEDMPEEGGDDEFISDGAEGEDMPSDDGEFGDDEEETEDEESEEKPKKKKPKNINPD